MYQKFAEATREFEEQVSLITRIYERGLRMAHEKYYDAITGINMPIPDSKDSETVSVREETKLKDKTRKDDQVQEALDMIFSNYANR